MYLHVDARTIPTSISLHEADDFANLKIVLTTSNHLWIQPDTLTNLAGKTEDSDWRARLDNMVDYAASKGWVDEEGRVRIHVEVDPDQ